jgi:hypothetical protein
MQDPILALFKLYFTIVIYIFLISSFLTLVWIYLTNPFRKITFVKLIFSSTLIGITLFLFKKRDLYIHKNVFFKSFAWIKSGFHIFKNAMVAAPKAKGETIQQVITSIHKLRFNPDKPFLISGDHFSVFYPRNLGIFYYCILDPRVALNEQDWVDRERKYLQSTAFALEAFSQANELSTTIVPTGSYSVALINIFAYPSDTLYAVLHALEVMISSKSFTKNYPFESDKTFVLHTSDASNVLLDDYGEALKKLYNSYKKTVFDSKSGFIKKTIRLSSHLDTKIRHSSFYDNVIYWKTTQLAAQLGIIEKNESYLNDLKKQILETFWYEAGGYFLDDLSNEGIENKWYSSDWVIALTTGFINPLKKSELHYFEKIVVFIQKEGLDKPFPLKVIGSQTKEKDHFWVRTFASEYQDSAIWSNLGMQYIKALTLLYSATGEKKYLQSAQDGIKAYQNNILKYKGYPELYDSDGKMFRTVFYRSIRQTSWVVDFEHAQAFVAYWTKQDRSTKLK